MSEPFHSQEPEEMPLLDDLDYTHPLWLKISQLKERIARLSASIDSSTGTLLSSNNEQDSSSAPHSIAVCREKLFELIDTRLAAYQDLLEYCQESISKLPPHSRTRKELRSIYKKTLSAIRTSSSSYLSKLSSLFDQRLENAPQSPVSVESQSLFLNALEELAFLR